MSTEKENGKVCLVLLEGIGISEEEERNAVKAANMEYLESLKQNEKCLYYELKANGSEVVFVLVHKLQVGLIDGTPGNSGVGILVVGAGKRQYRNIVRINQAIADGQFKTNETLQQVLKEVKEGNNTLHLIGSITDSMEESYYSLFDLIVVILNTYMLYQKVLKKLVLSILTFTVFLMVKIFLLAGRMKNRLFNLQRS